MIFAGGGVNFCLENASKKSINCSKKCIDKYYLYMI